MLTIRELTYSAIVLRIFLAILLGGVIGMERGMKNRPAGLRTYMLVCLGACMVMLTNQYVYQVYDIGDPVRMGAQVISGIGFLGVGTIIVTSRNQIKGLTTAAGLWASACIGLSLGIGLYEAAIIGAVCIFLILTLLNEMDFKMRRNTKQLDTYIELKENVPLRSFFDFIRTNAFEPSNFQMQTEGIFDPRIIAFNVTLKSHDKNHDEIIRCLRDMPGIAYIEELKITEARVRQGTPLRVA